LAEEYKGIITADTGANMIILYQMLKNRIISSLGHSPMGYALPAAMGIGEVVCVIGDGGIQMNIQELQTIKNYNIPIKVFVISNKGYGLIRQFQDLYMGKRHIGTEEGVPDFAKIARAYGIPSMTIKSPKKMRRQLKQALGMKQVIVNVITDPNTVVTPRAIFGKPIEEQHPFLPDEEVVKNLIVKRWSH
jgi:acetolactate synthase-1/2/3 large subunit